MTAAAIPVPRNMVVVGAVPASERVVRFEASQGETKMVTPLQSSEFFRDSWVGDGELIPHPCLRWLIRREGLRLFSQPQWLSDTIWLVKDRFEFSSGRVLERKMFCELVGPDRIHCTADEMPLGAEILLHDRGYRFTPYYALGAHRDGGRTYRVWCRDECRLDTGGFLHDTIRIYVWGFPVATMRIGPMSKRENGSGIREGL